jgi:hypothetical protein
MEALIAALMAKLGIGGAAAGAGGAAAPAVGMPVAAGAVAEAPAAGGMSGFQKALGSGMGSNIMGGMANRVKPGQLAAPQAGVGFGKALDVLRS